MPGFASHVLVSSGSLWCLCDGKQMIIWGHVIEWDSNKGRRLGFEKGSSMGEGQGGGNGLLHDV